MINSYINIMNQLNLPTYFAGASTLLCMSILAKINCHLYVIASTRNQWNMSPEELC